MNPFLRLPLFPALCCYLLLLSNFAFSMSQSPEDAPAKPADVVSIEHKNPESDARAALAKGDLRLLGFALRATVVPGVEATDRQAAMDACGVRLMKGFGDVVRSDNELSAMQMAFKYAQRYNTVVIERCLKKD